MGAEVSFVVPCLEIMHQRCSAFDLSCSREARKDYVCGSTGTTEEQLLTVAPKKGLSFGPYIAGGASISAGWVEGDPYFPPVK